MVPQPSARPRSLVLLTDGGVSARVRAEFHEMPGLKLTARQAARLFSIERAECEGLLRSLVDTGVLACEDGAFSLPGSGRRCA
jgi:hypothetical protein